MSYVLLEILPSDVVQYIHTLNKSQPFLKCNYCETTVISLNESNMIMDNKYFIRNDVITCAFCSKKKELIKFAFNKLQHAQLTNIDHYGIH